MELETQVQVSTNQLRRQDEEARQLRENLDAALQRERVLQARQREFQHKYADLESKVCIQCTFVYQSAKSYKYTKWYSVINDNYFWFDNCQLENTRQKNSNLIKCNDIM